MKEPITIVLADDHSLVRDGIKALLEDEPSLAVIGEAEDGDIALEKVKQLHPDLLIVDIRMPRLNGIETVRTMNTQGGKTKAIILSMHESEEYVMQSINAGAYGYLLKDTSREEFIKAIRSVYDGEKYFSGDISDIIVKNYLGKNSSQSTTSSEVISVGETTILPNKKDILTKRQTQILKMIASGMSNQDVAEQLGKSLRTIETHRYNMMQTMEAKNSIELIYKARQMGLLD